MCKGRFPARVSNSPDGNYNSEGRMEGSLIGGDETERVTFRISGILCHRWMREGSMTESRKRC